MIELPIRKVRRSKKHSCHKQNLEVKPPLSDQCVMEKGAWVDHETLRTEMAKLYN
jgi:hypothetical protein